MRWVEGLRLNEFVREHADKPAVLEKLALMWVRLAAELRDARLGHGDLQHGNVLLVPGSKNSSLALKLIDYDGMWVPALAARPSGEVGHPNYQHPQRLRDGLYGPEADRFAHLLVSAALRCVQAGGRELWDRHDNGENLLFREDDFRRPGDSRLLAELWALEAADAHALVGHLLLASQAPAAAVPRLEDLAARGAVEPLTAAEEARVDDLLRAARPAPRARGRARHAAAVALGPSSAGALDLPADTAPTAMLAVSAETVPEMAAIRAAAPAVAPPAPLRIDLANLTRLWPVGLAVAGLAVVLVLVVGVRLLAWSLGKPPHPQAPAEPQFARLHALPALTVHAGQNGGIAVAVERRDSAGPLTVRVEGAPERVSCPPLTLEDGRETGRLELGAAADAEAGDHPVRLTLWEGDRQTDEQAATLTVEKFLPPQLLREVGKVPLRPGGKLDLVVAVDRRGCAEALTLKLGKLPAGVVQRPVPSRPGEKAVRLELAAAAQAPASSEVLSLTLWAGPVPAQTQQVIVVVDDKPARSAHVNPDSPKAPRLVVKGPPALTPGGSQGLTVRLERNGYVGAVAVKVEGLAGAVTAGAAELAAGQDEVSVALSAGAAAADGSATARVQAWADGRKLDEREVTVTVRKPAPAALPPPQAILFFSGDGVTLAATYYPGPKGKEGGCVLLLHDPEPEEGPAADDWGRLARGLQARGHAALRLDFRGHGGSTKVGPLFWGRPENRGMLASLGTKPYAVRNRPWLVNDVTAARLFLDWKNDSGELNSSNLIVVGAGGGATVGMLWLAAECARYESNDVRATQPEVRYVAAAVWLDLAPTFPGRGHNPQREWLPTVGRRGVSMNFVCGARSDRNVKAARAFLGALRPAAGARDLCTVTAVPDTDKASQRLLQSEPATARLIEEYVEAVMKRPTVKPWSDRRVLRREYYWKVGNKTAPAKQESPLMLPVPLDFFGLR
jgi:hypothetical protein